MQTITPYLLYKDVEAALEFLGKAFGFKEVLRYTGEEGYVNHAEMQVGDAKIYMGDPGEQYRNPKDLGQETVGIYVLVDDVDGHFERAKAAGAEIKEEPTDQEYGERRYTARDPEGQSWFFAQPTGEVAPEEWGATMAGDEAR
ncbi:MAG: VOC family protein [Actinobacteria bacterium]|nr:VOC family protein [Actinomycetota bacterium]